MRRHLGGGERREVGGHRRRPERAHHPVEKRRGLGVVELRLRGAGDADQVLASTRYEEEAAEVAAQIGGPTRRALPLWAVAAAAVHDVVVGLVAACRRDPQW